MFPGEIRLLQWLETLRTPLGNFFWETVTLIGEDTVFIVLLAILYFMFHKKLAYRICFLTVTSLGINGILKNLLKIPRPFLHGEISCVRPETATGYSFPSGHTQVFATWSTALGNTLNRPLITGAAILCGILVGFSRMYLGAHYLSDVLAALLLGIGISWLGTVLCNRVSNEKRLYLWVLALFTPFLICFLIMPDPLYEDFFKCYGLLAGFVPSAFLEERYVNLTYQVPLRKRILRVILGILVAVLGKAALSLIPLPVSPALSLLLETIRYLLLVFMVFGIYPVFLKICHL